MTTNTEMLDEFLRTTGLQPTTIQREMAEHAEAEGFPIIGPVVGAFLAVVATAVTARSVFEFGSGFGYSASWFLRGMADDGTIVLTERDDDELELARSFFERTGSIDRIEFEQGDAVETVGRYDGPFDMVLIDHEKARYVEGFEAVRGRLAAGSVVIADNMMHGPFSFEDIADGVAGEPIDDRRVRGVVDYLDHVRSADGYATSVLPLGNGIAVTTRRP